MKIKIMAAALVLIVAASSFIYQKEVVKATSGWFYSIADADANCRAKLEEQDGNVKGSVRFYGREESKDEMKKVIYKTSCSCYKKEDKKQ